MQLKEKIYEAINTGIQKALILDQDVSMNYQHTKISNSINTISYHVHEFLECTDENDILRNFNYIIDINKTYGYEYTPKNIFELSNIYNQMCKIKKESFKWLNTAKSLILISRDGSEYTLDEYNKSKNIKAEFIKIKYSNGECIVHKSLMISSSISFSEELNSKSNNPVFDYADAINDYNGYEHTQENKNILELPLFKDVQKKDKFGYEAYVPALGELNVLFSNIDIVLHIMMRIDKKDNGRLRNYPENILKFYKNYNFWTSTEQTSKEAWTMVFPIGISNQLKSNHYGSRYIPFFKKI